MTEPDEDALIDRALAGASEAQWQAVWDAIDRVASDERHVTWGGGAKDVGATRAGSDGDNSVFQMPYAIYSDAVNALRNALHAAGLIVPFDWPGWEGAARYRAGTGMNDAPPSDAVRMITVVMRSERFSEGAIVTALEDGTLQAAIARLRAWHCGRSNV